MIATPKVSAKYFESLLQQINPKNKVTDLSNEQYVLQHLASQPMSKHNWYFIMRNDITKHYFDYLELHDKNGDLDYIWKLTNTKRCQVGFFLNRTNSDIINMKSLSNENNENSNNNNNSESNSTYVCCV